RRELEWHTGGVRVRAWRQRTGLGSATAVALGGLSIVALVLSACTGTRAGAGEEHVLGSETTLVAVAEGEQAAGGGRDQGGSRLGIDRSGETDATAESGATDAADDEVFDRVVAGIEQAPPDVADFFDDITRDRVDELATGMCEELSPELSLAELAALTVAGRDDLTSAERNLLDLAGYRLAIGVMVGAYCPEQLPLDADVILADVQLGDPDAYREILPSLFPADHGAAAFVEQLSDRRLEQLQRAACRATARAETLVELGAAIVDQYDDVLRATERQAVDVDEYIDLVGSLLGWFCPAELVPDLSP
ncbi:MAG: hypothetical protein OEV40_30370, partial [Acidimicrobiia bacterium]|nr:hypothetical protein [Acidimicrobiia bacterium]